MGFALGFSIGVCREEGAHSLCCAFLRRVRPDRFVVVPALEPTEDVFGTLVAPTYSNTVESGVVASKWRKAGVSPAMK